jgi:hypothetical protein
MKYFKQSSNGTAFRVLNCLYAIARLSQGSISTVQQIIRNRVQHIKHVIKLIALAVAFCASPIVAETSNSLHVSIIGGLTFGGDRVGGLQYVDGSTSNLDAGALAYFGGGLEYHINDSFILQLNAQYHWDTAAATNGDMTFSRYEFEAIPYYRINERYRIGLGYGMHSNVHLSSDFTADLEYNNANAIIGSVGRLSENSDSWLEFRVVSVEYELNKVGNQTVASGLMTDANHIGVSYHWLF